MPLILAIEPDRRQASKIAALAKSPLHAELVVAESTAKAFTALGSRAPDLILTSLLLSPKDENALADRLRELDSAGTHVQTLVIPVLETPARRSGKSAGGLLTRLRRAKGKDAAPDGCDPAVFAAQITEYLERAAAERRAAAVALEDEIQGQQDPVYATRQEAMAVASNLLRRDDGAAPASVDIASAGFEAADMPSPPAAPPETPSEERWEEIVLEDGESSPAAQDPSQPAVVLSAEPIDLEAFVEELNTVQQRETTEREAAAREKAEREAAAREKAAREAAAREAAAREAAAREAVAREKAAREQAAREKAAREKAAREKAAREQAARETAAREAAAREAAAREAAAQEAAAREAAAREKAAREQAARETAAREAAAREKAAQEKAAREKAVREAAAREAAAREAAAREHAAREAAARETAAKETAAREKTAREQAAREKAAPASASDDFDAQLVEFLHDVEAPPAAARQAPASPAASPDSTAQPEWMHLLTAIKRDIEQLRTDRAEETASREPQEILSEPVDRSKAASKGGRTRQAATKKRKKVPVPVQDEWGFFDPEQCGFAALLAKLDEITDQQEETPAKKPPTPNR